jgi:hypothetical protein
MKGKSYDNWPFTAQNFWKMALREMEFKAFPMST